MKPTTILALVASLTLTAAAPGAPPITIAENGLVMKAIEKRMAAPEPGQQPYPRPGPGGSPGEPSGGTHVCVQLLGGVLGGECQTRQDYCEEFGQNSQGAGPHVCVQLLGGQCQAEDGYCGSS